MTAHGIREKSLKSFLDTEAYTVGPTKLVAPMPNVEVSANKNRAESWLLSRDSEGPFEPTNLV